MTVQLFATCLGDLIFPSAVADADALLREAGHDVVFPQQQICCGQPAYNAGHRSAARRGAKTFPKAFAPDLPVGVPSGSCATMLSQDRQSTPLKSSHLSISYGVLCFQKKNKR